MWDIIENDNLFVENVSHDTGLPGVVSVKPDDIGTDELLEYVETVNKHLNRLAADRRNSAKDKYRLSKGRQWLGTESSLMPMQRKKL